MFFILKVTLCPHPEVNENLISSRHNPSNVLHELMKTNTKKYHFYVILKLVKINHLLFNINVNGVSSLTATLMSRG